MSHLAKNLDSEANWKSFAADLHATWKMAKDNHLPLFAAAISFFSLFAVCPFLILTTLLSQFLGGSQLEGEAVVRMKRVIDLMVPSVSPFVSENLITLMGQNSVANWLSTGFLIFASYELFSTLHTVFAKISVRGKKRNLFWSNVVATLAFSVAGITTACFLVFSTANAEGFRSLLGPDFQDINLKIIRGILYLGCLGLVIVCLSVMYKIMPTQKIKSVFAFRAAFLFLVLCLVGRVGHEGYLAYYRMMNQGTYGGFLSMLIIVLWIYYLSYIFLFCGQFTIYQQEREREMQAPPNLSNATR